MTGSGEEADKVLRAKRARGAALGSLTSDIDREIRAGLTKLLEPPTFKQLSSALLARGLSRPSTAKSASDYWKQLTRETMKYAKGAAGSSADTRHLQDFKLDALASKGATTIKTMLETGFHKNSKPSARDISLLLRRFLDNARAARVILAYLHYELEEISDTHDPLKKKYRRRAELPDPTKSADAEVNRPTVQVKLRIAPQIAAVIDDAVADSGETRSDWLVDAAVARIKRERPELFEQLKHLIEPS